MGDYAENTQVRADRNGSACLNSSLTPHSSLFKPVFDELLNAKSQPDGSYGMKETLSKLCGRLSAHLEGRPVKLRQALLTQNRVLQSS